MTVAGVLAELDRLIGEAPPRERPGLVVALSARLAALGAGLAVPTEYDEKNVHEKPPTWLKPEEVAAIAGVPVGRIYSWAKGQRWASRPTRRCLRINETAFRSWLASRTR